MLPLPLYIASSFVSLIAFAFIVFKLMRPKVANARPKEDEEKLISSKVNYCNCSRNQNATNLGWKLLCEKLSEEKLLLLQEANELRRINYELKIIIQGYDETLETIGLG